jgi:transposase InsO family protein
VSIYFLKNKDKAAEIFTDFMAKEEAVGHSIYKVRFDNGGEFRSISFVEFLRNKGLLLKPIPAYSPESNGLAERVNSII